MAMTLTAQTDGVSHARRVLDLLRQEKFADVTKEFNAQMAAALPAQTLAQVWAAMRTQVGEFKSESSQQSANAGGVNVVTLGVQFERAAANMVVAFDAENKIAGLQFVPRPAEAPAASLPAGLTEEAFTVGTGQLALQGTLTLPPGTARVAAVVLVHGSGPEDRDETLGPNKPFRDLAWGLASRGVAVLRYEKRTRQYAAAMAQNANLTVREEAIDDAVLAEQALRRHARIEANKVYIAGHSLGGMLAPRIGQEDRSIAGLILLAACANLGGLFAARAADRSREVALRLALGSSRKRILRQLMTEALVLSLSGGTVGLLGSVMLLRRMSMWQPFPGTPIRIPISPDAKIYAVAFVVALVSGLLFGIVPVRQVLRTNPYEIVKAGASGRIGRRMTVRDALLEPRERLDLTERVSPVRGLNRRDVDEAHAVLQLERRVPEPCGRGTVELLVDRPDELLIGLHLVGLHRVAHDHTPHLMSSLRGVSKRDPPERRDPSLGGRSAQAGVLGAAPVSTR